MHKLFIPAFVVLLGFAQWASAQNPEASNDREEQMKQLAAGLQYRQGVIALGDGLATLKLTENFRYLDHKDAETVLTKIWGNPPDLKNLGMLVPANMSPVDQDCWAVVISYQEDGYVKDNDAEKIDYNDLLQKLQKGTQDANPKRVEGGYPSLALIGWAAPPHYDKATHKLYWAQELSVGDFPSHTLNYNIRMLGRKGVLVLNAIAGMNQLHEVEAATPAILSMVDFKEGHRYVDFNSSTDKVATYGIVGLIAGGVLAKAGFFKLLIPALLAAKKLILVGLAAAAAMFKKLKAKVSGNRNQTPGA